MTLSHPGAKHPYERRPVPGAKTALICRPLEIVKLCNNMLGSLYLQRRSITRFDRQVAPGKHILDCIVDRNRPSDEVPVRLRTPGAVAGAVVSSSLFLIPAAREPVRIPQTGATGARCGCCRTANLLPSLMEGNSINSASAKAAPMDRTITSGPFTSMGQSKAN